MDRRPPTRPHLPDILAGLGAVWILAIALIWTGIEVVTPIHASFAIHLQIWADTAAELACGAVAVVAVRWALHRPDRYRLGGLLCAACGLLSLEFPPAGLLLGPVLAVVGGIWMALRPPR